MGVTIDSINEYIYTGAYDQETFRARLDGTSKEIVFPKGKTFVVYLICCARCVCRSLSDASITPHTLLKMCLLIEIIYEIVN